jgi:hypothetical protein
MRGTEQTSEILVVLGALIGIPDNESDGASCRFALEHAAKQLHLVGFLSLSGYLALAWTPAVQLLLDEIQIDIDACRHTVDYSAYGFSMTFSEGGQRE